MDRREFHAAVLAAAMSGSLPGSAAAADAPPRADAARVDHDMSGMPPSWHGSEQIAMLLYPEFTALDLVGPQYMFANLMGATVHLVAKTAAPVMSDTRFAIVPTTTFDQCPRDLDILFVPGGTRGTLDAMADDATIRFLADRGARARLVTSVCTGSLVLGAAGLLEGYRATSHWVTRGVLERFGAIPVDARVVRDRNRITGAGVTAGLDFGLSIVGDLRDRQYAETVQLLAEYAPDPPFNAGTVRTAPPGVTQMLDEMFVDFVARANAAAVGAAARGR